MGFFFNYCRSKDLSITSDDDEAKDVDTLMQSYKEPEKRYIFVTAKNVIIEKFFGRNAFALQRIQLTLSLCSLYRNVNCIFNYIFPIGIFQ